MKLISTTRVLGLLVSVAMAPAALASTVPVQTPTTTEITLYPNSPGVVSAAGDTATGAPGFGTSSFQENGNTKGELYITPGQLFSAPVTFGDIASVSYWTNKPGASNGVDWSFYVYTALTGSGNTGSFYHSRLTSEPIYSNAAAVPSNTWHQWTSDGDAPMRFYDAARDGGIQGTNSDPTLATLESGAYTWSASQTTNDYRGELIEYFSMQTGSAWAAGFPGLLDGLTITLRNGDVGIVNFAAINAAVVPEPASIALFGIGAAGLLAARRRRNV